MNPAYFAAGFVFWILIDFSKVPFRRGSPFWVGLFVFEVLYLMAFATFAIVTMGGS